jgi:hypothetical protein
VLHFDGFTLKGLRDFPTKHPTAANRYKKTLVLFLFFCFLASVFICILGVITAFSFLLALHLFNLAHNQRVSGIDLHDLILLEFVPGKSEDSLPHEVRSVEQEALNPLLYVYLEDR